MGKSLSDDLRVRVVEAVEAGASRRQAAARFGVSVSSAIRWVRAWHAQGDVRAKPQGGDRRSVRIEAHGRFLLDQIEQTPDVTLAELQGMLRKRGVSVGIGTMWRFFDRRDISFKKNRARRRARPARRRGAPVGLVRGPARS
jgi:transposase